MATRHHHQNIVRRNPITPNSRDLAQWDQLKLPNDAFYALREDRVDYHISAGLFGADMTDFLYACGRTAYCNYDFYYGFYDGWAVGVYF